MKVALLAFGQTWGGAEVHAVQLARALSRRGHQVSVLCLTERTFDVYRSHEDASVSIVPLATHKPATEMRMRHWLRHLRTRADDVSVLVKGDVHTGGGWAIDLAARRTFGCHIVIEHSIPEPLGPRLSRRHLGIVPGIGLWWYREHFRRYLRSLGPHRVVCVSEAIRRQLVEGDHFASRKVETRRNGIDVNRFRPDVEQRAIWRDRWGIPSGALVFGAVGRFVPIKAFENALDAFQLVLPRFPNLDLRLVLVGQGPLESSLRQQAERMSPSGGVVFSPFTPCPWEALSAFDVFVMPSRSEGLPLALIEAMACGCCPVAANVGGVPEVLSRRDVGWLVADGSPDVFAAGMEEAAAASPSDRAEMATLAREHVIANFDAATQFNALVDLIESVARQTLNRA